MKTGNIFKTTTWLTWITVLSILVCSQIALADDACSEKGLESVAGQIAIQIYEALNLTSDQTQQIMQISSQAQQEFKAWNAVQAEKRNVFLGIIERAMQDGRITAKEAMAISEARGDLKSGRRDMFIKVATYVHDIDLLLTDQQKDALRDLQITVSFSEDVISAGEGLKSAFNAAAAEYRETGTVSEGSVADVKAAWQVFLSTIYLPDALRANMDGRAIALALERLKSSDLVPQRGVHGVDIEKVKETLSKVLEDASHGGLSMEELMEDLGGLSEATGRLSTFYSLARVSFLEAFMLTPVFNCHLR